MKKNLVSINDLPPDGKNFVLTDQQIWTEPLREYKMDCRIADPLQMKIFLMGVEGGCLCRGELTGAVIVPCNRCGEEAQVDIDSHFDEFEEIPESDNPSTGQIKTQDGHIVFERNSPMLNLDEVAWEQFMLAMPASPLCREDCQGLCAQCGTNLNLGQCDCHTDAGDERMAPLRGLKLQK